MRFDATYTIASPLGGLIQFILPIVLKERRLDNLLLDDVGSGDLLDGGDGKLVVGVLLMISGGDGDLLDGDVLDAVFSIASGGVDPILRRR
ncbi:hypothetical protein E2562_015096 [Oryza meyeriana var. granulata]|uniref:Uncharacterized protein n=1 Tax=Oryza meyeriana var. granulata TaxID=110450 RepID=A0A6G1DXI4_9ORYZ|nr:hypothetical protein E2562_015096 [Oryza meyeriana var. granulata]